MQFAVQIPKVHFAEFRADEWSTLHYCICDWRRFRDGVLRHSFSRRNQLASARNGTSWPRIPWLRSRYVRRPLRELLLTPFCKLQAFLLHLKDYHIHDHRLSAKYRDGKCSGCFYHLLKPWVLKTFNLAVSCSKPRFCMFKSAFINP